MTNWDMVEECREYIDEMNEKQAQFIEDLFNHCSPGEELFHEETTEKQRDWLYVLWDFYCNGNEEAFDDWDY